MVDARWCGMGAISADRTLSRYRRASRLRLTVRLDSRRVK